MSDKQSTQGTEDQSTQGANAQTAQQNEQSAEGTQTAPPDEPKVLTNADLKAHPWVQDLIKQASKLQKLEKEQAEARDKAEQERLKASGDFESALNMERKKYEELESRYKSETKLLALTAEMAANGLTDTRLVKLFAEEFNAEEESAAEYVKRVKADPQNAVYFTDSTKRVPSPPPPPAGGGKADDFTPDKAEAWKNSSDASKRERAIAYYTELYSKGMQKG